MGTAAFCTKRKLRLWSFFLSAISLFLIGMSSPASAGVDTWEISSHNTYTGNTLIINGIASPKEEVEISISYDQTIPVYLRKYTYEVSNIEVLNLNSFFTFRAEGVEDLNIKIKALFPKVKYSRAENGIVILSSPKLLPGEYDVKIKGTAKDRVSAIKLRVTSIQKLTSGKDGKFSYRFKTASTPSQVLKIKVGNQEKLVTLKPKTDKLLQESATPFESSIFTIGLKSFIDTDFSVTNYNEKEKISLNQSPAHTYFLSTGVVQKPTSKKLQKNEYSKTIL